MSKGKTFPLRIFLQLFRHNPLRIIRKWPPDSFIFFYLKKYIFVAVLTKFYNYGGHRSKS